MCFLTIECVRRLSGGKVMRTMLLGNDKFRLVGNLNPNLNPNLNLKQGPLTLDPYTLKPTP